jgi:hypothetical protein
LISTHVLVKTKKLMNYPCDEKNENYWRKRNIILINEYIFGEKFFDEMFEIINTF